MTARPASIGLAFLGCGKATRMHSRTLARLAPEVRLHYASRDLHKARRVSDEHGGVGAYGSYESAIEDSAIHVVLVATPPPLHLDLTLAALSAGKDVIVEKPAFLHPEDFGPVREAMSRSGQRVFVAENYFYKPLRRRLLSILEEGIVGDPLFLHVNAIKRQQPEDWRASAAASGGGGLFEGGIHWINLMANLGMDVQAVSGYRAGVTKGLRDGNRETEESIHVVMNFTNGAVGTLSFSWEVPSPLQGIRISKLYGREGSVTFESNGIFVFASGSRTRLSFPGFRDLAGYRAMFTDFLAAIRTGRDPLMTLDIAEQDVRLVRDIYRSIELNDS